MHVKKQCPNIRATDGDILFVSFNKRSSLCIVSKLLKLTPAGCEVDLVYRAVQTKFNRHFKQLFTN